MKYLEKANSQTESRLEATGEENEGREGKGGLLLNGHRVSAWGDEKVLKTDSYDSCTTSQMYLMPLNWTLKMVKVVNFVLCISHTTILKNNNVIYQKYTELYTFLKYLFILFT